MTARDDYPEISILADGRETGGWGMLEACSILDEIDRLRRLLTLANEVMWHQATIIDDEADSL